MDLAALKALKPSEYQDAADGYRATSEMAGKAGEALDSRISAGIRNQLSGETAKAALRELKELSKDFHYAAAECALAGAALDGFAFDMAAAKRKLEAALEDAAAAGCTVGADGSVSFPAGGKEVDGKVPEGGTVRVSTSPTDPTSAALERQAVHMHPNPNFGKAVGFADRIGDALKEATDADVKWAPKLRALKADDDLVVSDKDWIDVTSDTAGVRDAGKDYFDSLPQPPKNESPKDNAAWWKGLTDEQRSDYLAVRPDAVGALDGLPATARDQANRTVLDEAHAKARLDYDAWLKKHPEPERYQPYIDPYTGSMPKGLSVESQEWKDWEEARKNARKSLDGMDAIQTRFDATGVNGLPEAYLLGFSTDGDGRAIIANGNPDTADHQAVYVPGTGSELGNIGGGIDRMTKVWHAASDEADGKSVSTITWLGYDAPDSVWKDAPFEHYAYDGAPAFDKFLDGLDTSHTGDTDPHRTVIAHSYGTTLVGAAAQKGHVSADDLVFAGSPGVKVSDADELDVPKGHVWNEEADGDVVPDIGRWGHGGDGFIIPSDPHFGANQMTTDTEGHSGYWDETSHGPSQSLKNQALVVVGKGDDVALKPPPNEWAHVK
ncbi:alpha/beta hydrolase [Streptomyces sp. CMSTAAHL-2]|uniref:alpha/beta hydrolase n=1 Tax=Streptomyces sp. CMSTAAHL-2 TaxID=2904522 RepID=UPI001E3EDA3B|nr:alpha/beta hydrolase [Streptomyces sp. CMSTAAHL-2]MCE3034086.1 alpha/beta hydrolase family protein [Streptomyces sp. CMSTAAHL-2]